MFRIGDTQAHQGRLLIPRRGVFKGTGPALNSRAFRKRLSRRVPRSGVGGGEGGNLGCVRGPRNFNQHHISLLWLVPGRGRGFENQAQPGLGKGPAASEGRGAKGALGHRGPAGGSRSRGRPGQRGPEGRGAPSAGLAQPHWARRRRAPPPGSVVSMAAAAFVVPRVKQKAGAARRGSEERG